MREERSEMREEMMELRRHLHIVMRPLRISNPSTATSGTVDSLLDRMSINCKRDVSLPACCNLQLDQYRPQGKFCT